VGFLTRCQQPDCGDIETLSQGETIFVKGFSLQIDFFLLIWFSWSVKEMVF